MHTRTASVDHMVIDAGLSISRRRSTKITALTREIIKKVVDTITPSVAIAC